MKKSLILALVIGSLLSFGVAQTTPNLHLNIPLYNAQDYNDLINANSNSLDSYLSGGTILPAFKAAGLTLSGTGLTTNTITTTGNVTIGGNLTIVGSLTGSLSIVNLTLSGTLSTAGTITPSVAAGTTIGTAPLPFSSLFFGNAANNSAQITGTFSANRVVTFPDVSMTVSGSIFEDCGATSGSTQNCAATIKPVMYIVRGQTTLNGASSQAITNLPFSGSTYSCAGSDQTNTLGLVDFGSYGASSVVISQTGGGNTDLLKYICIGF